MSLELYVNGRIARAKLNKNPFSLAMVRPHYAAFDIGEELERALGGRKDSNSDLIIPHDSNYVLLLNGGRYDGREVLPVFDTRPIADPDMFVADRKMSRVLMALRERTARQNEMLDVSVGLVQYAPGLSVDDLLLGAELEQSRWMYNPDNGSFVSRAYRPRDTKKIDLQPVA